MTAYCSQDALAAALPYEWPALADAAAGDDSVVEAGGLFDARHDRSDGQVSATRLNVARVGRVRTASGSYAYADFIPDEDNVVVERVKAAGGPGRAVRSLSFRGQPSVR